MFKSGPRTFGNTVMIGAYKVSVEGGIDQIRENFGLKPMEEEPHITTSFLPHNRIERFKKMF